MIAKKSCGMEKWDFYNKIGKSMKHIKLFEDVDSSNWENLFRTIAKFAKPITMDQFIYWNEDLVLDSEAWIEITSFLTKK